jgi:hypothetical protein
MPTVNNTSYKKATVQKGAMSHHLTVRLAALFDQCLISTPRKHMLTICFSINTHHPDHDAFAIRYI